ncbi:hypothetical protein ACUV84_015281 [Puccinellia chinampoensis]
MASSSVLLGAGGAAVLTGTPAGNAVPRPCFLAARPRALSGGRLCLTPPRASPEYNKGADATEGAIEAGKGIAAEVKKGVAEAAEAVSSHTDKAVEATGEGRDFGAETKKAAEDAFDGAKEAAKGVTDKVAAETKAAAKE